MITIDVINIFLSFWLKPMLLLTLMISVVTKSYRFSAASSHWLLVCTLFITCACVVLAFWLPNIPIAVLPATLEPMTNAVFSLENIFSLVVQLFVAVYVLGVAWITSFQLLALWEIKKLSDAAKSLNDASVNTILQKITVLYAIKKDVRIFISSELESPIMWGHSNPIILLPTDYHQWSTERLQRILAHEISHVQRNDWLIKVCGKFVCAVLWPVPLVWYVVNKIEWFAELSCDDNVIETLDCRAEYAEDLLSFSTTYKQHGLAMSLIQSSSTFLRIDYVLDSSNDRIGINKITKLMNLVICVVLIVPFSVVSAVPRAHVDIYDVKKPEYGIDLLQNKKPIVTDTKYIGENPSHYKYFINVLPDSPNFTEEMIITAAEVREASIRNELENSFNSKASSANTISLKDTPNFSPYTEVKGMLPRVMSTPVYPAFAIRRKIEGEVIVQFDISEEGRVFNSRIVYSKPRKIFDKAVLRALKKSKFTPMEVEGRLIKIKNITQTYMFKFNESATDKKVIERPKYTGIAGYQR